MIGVIVVDYRSDPLLERALIALAAAASALPVKVVVIQNQPIRDRPKVPEGLSVEFYPQAKNLGFGRAVNLARRSLQTPYFFLLNPDVEVFPNTLSVLFEY